MLTLLNICLPHRLLQSMLNPFSDQADRIARLFNYFNIAAGGMMLLVSGLTLNICIRFRNKKTTHHIPEQTKGNNKVEALMITVPGILLAFFFCQTVSVMHSVAPEPDHFLPPDDIITGHQFWWEVSYPAAGVTSTNEIHLPVGKRVLLELKAADVIHDWWVPALGNKMDLIPGKINHLWLNINKADTYAGVCSEFCGAQHAWMRLNVMATDSTSYRQWLHEVAATALHPADSLSAKGSIIFAAKTCGGCHNISGTASNGQVGPNLTHFASREKMLG
jgi:cytochrome c oxidase subunit 2